MFNGDEQVKITTDCPEEEFEPKVIESLESLGQVEISDRGHIVIYPKTSMASFFSTVTITGRIRKKDDVYRVNIQYVIAPSSGCWVLAVVLFVFLCMIGGAIIFAPLVIDKPNVARAVENALRDLKDSFARKKIRGKSSSDD